jgi:hypothetical protein
MKISASSNSQKKVKVKFWTLITSEDELRKIITNNPDICNPPLPILKEINLKNHLFLSFANGLAISYWRKETFQKVRCIKCKLFLNKSNLLNSMLINAAVSLIKQIWPNHVYIVEIDPVLVDSQTGYCFKVAGWIPVNTANTKITLKLEG